MRSIAEYIVAMLPGAILLFAFFVASESTVLFLGGDSMVVTFLPVVCLMPLLSGAVSTLVLEKIRMKILTLKRGALVGALSGLSGSLVSVLLLLVVFLVGKKPFGSTIMELPFVLLSFVGIIGICTVLSMLGGVLAAKFIKEL
jgi:hypothetical protein